MHVVIPNPARTTRYDAKKYALLPGKINKQNMPIASRGKRSKIEKTVTTTTCGNY